MSKRTCNEYKAARGPLRIAHVLGSLGRGGAETWLAQVVPLFDPEQVRVDVVTVGEAEGPYRAAVQNAGSGVFACRAGQHRLVFVRAFLRVLREQGPYDVVHAHLQLFSGLVLRLAHLAGVPVRIAHSRNASDGKQPTLGRRVYRALMLRWLGRYAAHRLAVSREAALGAFGPVLGDLDHCELMSGLDFGPFAGSVDRSRVRKTLGISDRARVIGHVGSFTKKKNHRFLIDVAFRCMERDGDIMLLLVGSGPLEGEIRRTVAASPYGNRVIVLGDRPDVPALMGGAMDAFLLPSLTEGLPRVLLEAQSSGLACVVSTEVTREAAAPCSRVLFVNLTAPISEWCDATNEALRSRSDSLRNEVIAYFEKRGLTTESNARRLTQLYRRLRDECE